MDWVGSRRGGGQRGESWSSLPFMDVWDPLSRGGADDTSALAHAHVDWRETDTAHIFPADLLGVSKENLKVQVEDNNILVISRERMQEQEDKNDKWQRVERRRGSFTRRFRLPENANMDQIGRSLKDGVLTVTVDKKETEAEMQRPRMSDVLMWLSVNAWSS